MRAIRHLLVAVLITFAAPARAEEPLPPDEVDDLEALRKEIEALRATVAAQAERIDLHDGQVEALETRAANRDAAVPPFRIYGWIDAGLQKTFAGHNPLYGSVAPTEATTFVLGNINLYFDIQPVEKWSALVEVRLTTAPDGSDYPGTDATGPYRQTSTTITDPTSPQGWQKLRWGALVLERAYLQWAPSEQLTLRLGTWLTPYGIWNVDHGMPTLISMILPQGNVVEMLPPRQTGLQLLGRHHFGSWTLHYVGTLSNGRDPTRLDPNEEKAVGGRLVLEHTGATRLALGASFYVGRHEEQQRTLTSLPDFVLERYAVIAYDEQGFGADASLDVGRLRLRTEATFRHAAYDEGKRETVYGAPDVFWSDRHDLDWYLLGAYRLPWLGLEPYVLVDWMRWPTFLGSGVVMPSAGLNIHFTASTQLKLQYAQIHFWGPRTPGQDDLGLFVVRAVVAF